MRACVLALTMLSACRWAGWGIGWSYVKPTPARVDQYGSSSAGGAVCAEVALYGAVAKPPSEPQPAPETKPWPKPKSVPEAPKPDPILHDSGGAP